MLEFKVNGESKELPTDWNDLTVEQVLRLHEVKTFEQGVKIITGYELEQIPKDFHWYFLFITKDYIPEQAEIEQSETIKIDEAFYRVPDVREMTWGQKIMACRLLREMRTENNIYKGFISIVSIYLQPLVTLEKYDEKKAKEFENKLLSLLFVDVYLISLNLIKQLKEVIEMEHRNLSDKPDLIQEQAGVSELRKLGEFNDIDLIAHGKPWLYEKVLGLDYNTIYVKLLHIKKTRIFETNYNRLVKSSK